MQPLKLLIAGLLLLATVPIAAAAPSPDVQVVDGAVACASPGVVTARYVCAGVDTDSLAACAGAANGPSPSCHTLPPVCTPLLFCNCGGALTCVGDVGVADSCGEHAIDVVCVQNGDAICAVSVGVKCVPGGGGPTQPGSCGANDGAVLGVIGLPAAGNLVNEGECAAICPVNFAGEVAGLGPNAIFPSETCSGPL